MQTPSIRNRSVEFGAVPNLAFACLLIILTVLSLHAVLELQRAAPRISTLTAASVFASSQYQTEGAG